MKRKVQKLLSKKNGLSNSETFKFLSAASKNNIGLNAERYRMILDCGYVEKEEDSETALLLPKLGNNVIRNEKYLQLFAKCAKYSKK